MNLIVLIGRKINHKASKITETRMKFEWDWKNLFLAIEIKKLIKPDLKFLS